MPDITVLVLTHYLCNAAAAQMLLPPPEVVRCNANYAALKATFEPHLPALDATDPARAALNASAYRQWKAWEAENAAGLAPLRAEAERRLAGGETGL